MYVYHLCVCMCVRPAMPLSSTPHLIFPLWDSIYHYMHWLNRTLRSLINAISCYPVVTSELVKYKNMQDPNLLAEHLWDSSDWLGMFQ